MNYSHGFEEIYALEKVDVKTIRTIPIDEKSEPPKKGSTKKPPLNSRHQLQLQLELGDVYKMSLPSFLLTEPIEQLELSPNLLAWLHSRSILTIEKLLKTTLDELPDNHHQEVEDAVEDYIAGRPLYETQQIDYAAWLRGLLGAKDPIATYCFLETYGLEDLFTLETQRRIEVRRLSLDTKQLNIHIKRDEIKGKSDVFSKATRQVVEVLIRPWLRGRGGLASRLELTERLIALGEDPVVAASVIKVFEEVYCHNSFWLVQYLYHADKKLFCSDEHIADAYDIIVDKALGYFYNDNVVYSLQELEQYLLAEMTASWCGFPDGFIRKVIRLSPRFNVRRNEEGILMVFR